jgi:hypothetical protein
MFLNKMKLWKEIVDVVFSLIFNKYFVGNVLKCNIKKYLVG